MNKKITGKDPRGNVKLPDFKETEPDIDGIYKSKQQELDGFWDGETIREDEKS